MMMMMMMVMVMVMVMMMRFRRPGTVPASWASMGRLGVGRTN